MTLISEAELNRLRDRQLIEYNPSVRSMTKLQSLIEKVFDDKTLAPDEKQKILNCLQERFSQLYSKYKTSSSSSPDPAVSTVPSTPSLPELNETREDVSELGHDSFASVDSEGEIDTPSFEFPEIGLAKRYDRKLGLFKDFLMENKNVLSPSPRDELVVDQKAIPNSSFTDLVRNMYVRGKSLNLTGSEEFMKKLAHLNVDPSMFSNSDNILLLTGLLDANKGIGIGHRRQTGKGKKRSHTLPHSNAPPGKLPRILRLFRI